MENATIPDPSECEGTGCNQTVLGPEADSGVDASFVDATVGDATVADGTVSDATAVDAASETSTADAVADSPAPVEAGRFLDAAPCDMGGLQPGSPWPMAGNCPNGRARSPLVGPASPVFKWSLVLQSGFAFGGATIGADGTVYVGTSGTTETGIDGGVIEALSPDGGVQWVYSPAGGAIFDQTPAIAADSTLRFWDYNAGTYNVLALDGSVLQSSPSIPCRGGVTIVSGGTIYTPDDEADLCAFNEAGVERWSVPGPSGDYAHPSVAADGTIFSDNGSSLLAGIFPDGGQRWSVSLDAGSGLSPIVVAPDGTLRVIGGDGYLYSLDPTTGGVLWRTYVDVAGTLGGMAISDDGNTYIGTRTQLVAIDLAGHPAGSIVVNGGTFLPIVDANGDVYTACDAGNQLCSYNHALTAQRWSVTLPGFPGVSVDTPIIGPGGMIYTLAGQTYFTGVLYALGPP
jgi:outer membrane protein assembly factor BamB